MRTGAPVRRAWGDVNKDIATFRVVEFGLAVAMVFGTYYVLSAGTLTSLGQSFCSWYTDKVDGMVTINVVDMSIKAPQLDRASLPLPPEPDVLDGASSGGASTGDASDAAGLQTQASLTGERSGDSTAP